MKARPRFDFRRAPARSAVATIYVRDDAGRLIGRAEGSGVKWRCWLWDDASGEFRAMGGTVPGEGPARAALLRRAGQ